MRRTDRWVGRSRNGQADKKTDGRWYGRTDKHIDKQTGKIHRNKQTGIGVYTQTEGGIDW
jgi:hypothetical protein